MTKREKLSEALDGIDSHHISDTIEYTTEIAHKSKSKAWIRLSAAVACLGLLVGAIALIHNRPSGADDGITVSENGVTIPQIEVTLSPLSSADMIQFFIYEERVYVIYEYGIEQGSLVGEWLGRSTGTIDEWTPKDGYVNFAGSVQGDFYTVNGYAPSFMLCMLDENGTVSTYINNNGITLKYGGELFEERLGASNYVTASGQTRASWYHSTGEPVALEGNYQDTLDAFLKALNAGQFIRLSDVPLQDASSDVFSEKEKFHLFLHMENGTAIHLRLFDGGYVYFQGIHGVCVKMDAEAFENMTALLDEQVS